MLSGWGLSLSWHPLPNQPECTKMSQRLFPPVSTTPKKSLNLQYQMLSTVKNLPLNAGLTSTASDVLYQWGLILSVPIFNTPAWDFHPLQFPVWSCLIDYCLNHYQFLKIPKYQVSNKWKIHSSRYGLHQPNISLNGHSRSLLISSLTWAFSHWLPWLLFCSTLNTSTESSHQVSSGL